MLTTFLTVFAAAALSAQASIVIGESRQFGCYEHALYDHDSAAARRDCNAAVDDPAMIRSDRAATFVNRGIVLMHRGDMQAALSDYDALALDPQLGDAHVNRAVVFIRQGRYADAIEAATTGLGLKVERPHAAYFNRAVAHEALDDLKNAYLDYRKASELAPDWAPPKQELARFSVAGANAS